VSQYGQVRGLGVLNENGWRKNKENTMIDHDIFVSYKDQNVPVSLAFKMVDITNQRKNAFESGKLMTFGSTMENANRQNNITFSDLTEFRLNSGKETHSSAPHTLLRGEQTSHLSGANLIPHLDHTFFGKIDIQTTIFEKMAMVNKKMGSVERDDLREEIFRTGETFTSNIEEKNKENIQREIKNEMLWKSESLHEKNNSMNVANYARILATEVGKEARANAVNFEDFQKKSFESAQRNGNGQLPTMYGMKNVSYDNVKGTEQLNAQLVGHMGSKYMRNHMDAEISMNNLNELGVANTRN
jgi:hypothetical protein